MSFLDGEGIEVQGSKLVIDSIPYTEAKFVREIGSLLLEDTSEEATTIKKLILAGEKSAYTKLATQCFYRLLKQHTAEEPELYIPCSMRPFVDYETGETKILNSDMLENPEALAKDIITSMNPGSFYASLPSEKIAKSFKYDMGVCRFVYEPYSLDVVTNRMLDNQEVVHINTYLSPEWLRTKPNDNERALHLFKILMDHLFPDQEHKEFVYVWIHRAIFQRNLTFLMLRGIRGNGKTTLLQIIAALVGTASKAQEDFFETNFNSNISGMRFVYKDEGDFDKKANNRVKSYLNKKVTVQEKFQRVKTDTEIHASFAMANNLEDRNYHLIDERKKSQPDLIDKKLDTIMNPKQINFLNNVLLERPDDLANIGNYIKDNYNPKDFKWEVSDPLKGEQFWMDILDCMTPFYKILVTKILDKEEEKYKLTQIQKLADKEKLNTSGRSQPPRTDRIIKTAKSFVWKDMEEPLFHIETVEEAGKKVRYAIPHEQYLPGGWDEDTSD